MERTSSLSSIAIPWKMISVWIYLCIYYSCGANAARLQNDDMAMHAHPRQHDKWVVITSVAEPTEAVRRLAELPGWRVVVVADHKTPQDWSLHGVDFLSVSKQERLDYRILQHVPWKNYGRKNIGYLWAIQHGATVIYETDDDNILLGSDLTVLDVGEYPTYEADHRRKTVNVYETYGQPNMWPRGFPLHHIRRKAPSVFQRKLINPMIQQGLANNDPDVDAIYRLTQPLGVNFNPKMFVAAIPEGLMCPFNSQNTVYLQEAFWGLLLPVTTSMRVCDIWRGYWVQRLLWEIGGSLCFTPPTVVQHRNPHTLLKDFQDEAALYRDAGRLVSFLRDWKNVWNELPETIVNLAEAMAKEGFWDLGDVDLTIAWVQDLNNLNYEWPQLTKEVMLPPEHVPSTPFMPKEFKRYGDVYLIIMYNTDVPHDVPSTLQLMYSPIFKMVIHTGISDVTPYTTESSVNMTWVPCEQHGTGRGIHMQECQAKAMHKYPGGHSGGYLLLGDDVLINICAMANLDTDVFWAGLPLEEIKHDAHGFDHDRWFWRETHGTGRTVEQNLVASFVSMSTTLEILGLNSTTIYDIVHDGNGTWAKRSWAPIPAEVHYVPMKYRTAFIALSMHFVREEVHADLIAANIMGILTGGDKTKYVNISGTRILDPGQRDNVTAWGLEHQIGMVEGQNWLHPLKMSVYHDAIKLWWMSLTCRKN